MDDAQPDLRASDAERDRAASQLREHYGAGRLSSDEFDERTGAAYRARTIGDLQPLLADLPALPAAAPPAVPDPEREVAKRRVLHASGTWAVISIACIAIWLATGAGGFFWPAWVILGMGIRLALMGWSELGPGGGERRRIGRGTAAQPRPRPAAAEQEEPHPVEQEALSRREPPRRE